MLPCPASGRDGLRATAASPAAIFPLLSGLLTWRAACRLAFAKSLVVFLFVEAFFLQVCFLQQLAQTAGTKLRGKRHLFKVFQVVITLAVMMVRRVKPSSSISSSSM